MFKYNIDINEYMLGRLRMFLFSIEWFGCYINLNFVKDIYYRGI